LLALSKWLLTYAQKIVGFAGIFPFQVAKSALGEGNKIVKKDDSRTVDKIIICV
jgi:hypothetical protein